ncbi:two-component system response regulator [candidate division KSB1 bacterium 4484_87]|nr:MAG: two-component system response regulator [candidate division KSB1 bacterium 4484_87]
MRNTPKILLVEDDQHDIELTLSALVESVVPKHEIFVVNDGEAALNYIFRQGEFSNRDENNPHLILLDIKMPKIDGHEVLRRVKSDPQFKQIPIVMLTSSRMEQDIRKCYEYGVNAYVVKPVNYFEFKESVQSLGNFWINWNLVVL